MLWITIPSVEQWDEGKQEFVYNKKCDLQLEHSLVSVAEWEAKWCKPFLIKGDKSLNETIDYVRCMTITQNVPPDVYNNITNDNIQKINRYIEAPMTATWFSEDGRVKQNRQQITSELIYYWMIALNIPFECQKWHLNRLLTLIRICNIKNQPVKRMSRKDIMSNNAALNAARRKRFNSKG